jgi:hypothetical protein
MVARANAGLIALQRLGTALLARIAASRSSSAVTELTSALP